MGLEGRGQEGRSHEGLSFLMVGSWEVERQREEGVWFRVLPSPTSALFEKVEYGEAGC